MSVMTWGEFKVWLASLDVPDQAMIHYVDVTYPTKEEVVVEMNADGQVQVWS